MYTTNKNHDIQQFLNNFWFQKKSVISILITLQSPFARLDLGIPELNTNAPSYIIFKLLYNFISNIPDLLMYLRNWYTITRKTKKTAVLDVFFVWYIFQGIKSKLLVKVRTYFYLYPFHAFWNDDTLRETMTPLIRVKYLGLNNLGEILCEWKIQKI